MQKGIPRTTFTLDTENNKKGRLEGEEKSAGCRGMGYVHGNISQVAGGVGDIER